MGEGDGVEDQGRRKLLGDIMKGVGGIAAVAVLGGATAEAVRPKGEFGVKTSVREPKEGDIVPFEQIASSEYSGFVTKKFEEITTQDRFDEIAMTILRDNPNFSDNYPKSRLINGRGFDPKEEVAVIYALGQKDNGYHGAFIKGAKYENGRFVVDAEETIPPVDHAGNIIKPTDSSLNVSPFDLVILPKLKDTKGNAVSYELRETQRPIPGPLIKSGGSSTLTSA